MAGIAEKHKLHDLCHNGKLRQVKEYLASDPNATVSINEQAGVFGYTPLHEAVSSKNANILQLLLTYGGQVNALSNGKYTPLHIAASIGDVECIKVLLQYDANISLVDEFGKTPFATAQLNKRKRSARLLKTSEIKMMAITDNSGLGKAIETLQCGQDVEQNCFEEALEMAVARNNHKSVGYLVIHGAKNVEECLKAALLKPPLYQTAALLLLCHAAKRGDKQVIEHMCKELRTTKFNDDSTFVGMMDEDECLLTRDYFPEKWNKKLTKRTLWYLRKAACSVDMAFPVSIALNEGYDEAAKIIVFQNYCNKQRGEADWHGLALSNIQSSWIDDIKNYKKLVLSHNILHTVPQNIVTMKNLLRLDLSKNYIVEVPKSIFELPMLRNLNLSNNEIGQLPKVREWSKSMKILNLEANNLRSIHDSIEQSELEDLNLSRNNLLSIQDCICNIKTLTTLDLSSNSYITVFPPELAKLTKLSFFGMKNMNQVTDPPPGLRETTSGLLRHLRAKLRHSEAYYTMKLMIVGLANKGKTTLMHRLDKDFAFNRNQSTKGVEIREIAISKARSFVFKFWDFAGQEEYYATHQCFLSQRSLYLLVWKVTDGEKGIASLKPWLDNLETRVPNSTVIIVGTHLDEVSEDEKTKGFEVETNNKVFALVSTYKKIISPKNAICMVTCNAAVKECRERIEKLRQLIYSVAEDMTITGTTNGPKIMGEMIPSSYLSLAKIIAKYQNELQEQNKIPILRKHQFEALVSENAKKNTKDIFDPDDVDNATKFLHDIGTILHYDDPNQDLRDLYFVNPSWLCELMAKVVTVKEAQSFIKDGVLYHKDIEFIIGKDKEKFPPEFYSQYLRLLYRFQIACSLDENRVLIPSQLPKDFPLEEARSIEPNHVLQRQHSFSCIPPGFWSRFIGRFLLYLKDMLTINTASKSEPSVCVQSKPSDAIANQKSITVDGNIFSSKENELSNSKDIADISAETAEKLEAGIDQDIAENESIGSADRIAENDMTIGTDISRGIVSNEDVDISQVIVENNVAETANTKGDVAGKDGVNSTDICIMVEKNTSSVKKRDTDIDKADTCKNKVENNVISERDVMIGMGEEKDVVANQSVVGNVGYNNDEVIQDVVDKDDANGIDIIEAMAEKVADVNLDIADENEVNSVPNITKDVDTNLSISPKDDGEGNLLDAKTKKDDDAKNVGIVELKAGVENGLGEIQRISNKDAKDEGDIILAAMEDNSIDVTKRQVIQSNNNKIHVPFILNSMAIQTMSTSPITSSTSFDDENSTPSSREVTPISLDETYSSASSSCSTPNPNSNQRLSSSRTDSHSQSLKVKYKPFRIEENHSLNDTHHYEIYQQNSDNSEEEFNEPVDISYLLGKKYLRCWRKGIIFSHPKLFLSVSVIPSKGNRQIIETRVSRNLLGYRALSFIVDHIRTLIKEWYPGLSGDNGLVPYVRQLVSCPVCSDFGFKPPFMFDISDCYKSSLTQEYILCSNSHIPQTISLRELCPDIMFMDLPSSLQLNIQELTYFEADDYLLGSGQFGKVYEGTHRGKPAAIKLSNFNGGEDCNIREALDNFYDVRQEVIILSKVKKHPYIISFLGVSVRPKLCSVMELARQGTLRGAIKGKMGHIERIIIYRIAQQIASALSYLHQIGIVHRDLKSDNVLVFSIDPTSEINAKLTDFGAADFMSCTGLKFFTGTPGFVAPEILEYSRKDEYTAKVDVYSFAMVLYESITKRRPFQDIAEDVLEISRQVKDRKRPIFGDLPSTRFGFLTLTQLMLKAWDQEAMKRPSSYEIFQQLKSPSFCLLYGKILLGQIQSPRHLCYIQDNHELWICCDDKSGASIMVIDLVNNKMKTTFTPIVSKAKDVYFNIVSINVIDKVHVAIILRSTNDYVHLYSSSRKKCIESYQVKDSYIRSMEVNENYVIIGCEDGGFLRIVKKDFIRGKFKEKSVIVNEKRSISAVVSSESNIFVGCDKYVYKYPLHFKQQDAMPVKMEDLRWANDKEHVSNMMISPDGQMLFISFSGSSVVTCRMVETMNLLGDINCCDVIKILLPQSDIYDQRVTCFTVHYNTLWVGTGSGHILIYEIKPDAAPSFITWLRPYSLEVRCIIACNSIGSNAENFIITIGKELNTQGLCQHMKGICQLTGSFPIDESLNKKKAKGQKDDKKNQNSKNSSEFERKNVLLIWDAVGAITLRRVSFLN